MRPAHVPCSPSFPRPMPRPATAAATARALAALARPGPATIAACSSSTLRALSFSAPRSLLAAAAVSGGETLARFPSPWQAHSASFASSAVGGSSHGEGGSGRADTPTAVTSQPPKPPPFVQAGPVPGEAGGVVTYLAPLATTVVRLKVSGKGREKEGRHVRAAVSLFSSDLPSLSLHF